MRLGLNEDEERREAGVGWRKSSDRSWDRVAHAAHIVSITQVLVFEVGGAGIKGRILDKDQLQVL